MPYIQPIYRELTVMCGVHNRAKLKLNVNFNKNHFYTSFSFEWIPSVFKVLAGSKEKNEL